jgi:hypothetical protein
LLATPGGLEPPTFSLEVLWFKTHHGLLLPHLATTIVGNR